jgi:hypothetical protein
MKLSSARVKPGDGASPGGGRMRKWRPHNSPKREAHIRSCGEAAMAKGQRVANHRENESNGLGHEGR